MISHSYNLDGLFSQNILHFLLTSHLIPLREYATKYIPSDTAKLFSLETSFDGVITTNLEELPDPNAFEFISFSAAILINSTYEKVKKLNLKHSSPTLEFFRHIRNAASHDLVFKLNKAEPKRPAKWKTLVIDSNLNGKPLFDFIAIGDLIPILQDVEKDIHGKDNWKVIQ